ncbi:hypothetical protein ZIOFF_011239 [Zingiber officinale]|uniref:Piwi domain-containing protein n=1 Tax=Zingiber officinale TaxID=94328 RepID=A0A8J5I7P5_ZINOF|nr:hypothetical protein ZIOFF_011239 [Zingiber officinale]
MTILPKDKGPGIMKLDVNCFQILELLVQIIASRHMKDDKKAIIEDPFERMENAARTVRWVELPKISNAFQNAHNKLSSVGGRGTVLVDALSRRIPLVSDQPTIIFGADVIHPHPGEDSSPSIAVARQELIQDMFNVWQDSQQGILTGGMIKTSAMQYLGSYVFPSKRLLDKSLNGLYSTGMNLWKT